MLLRIATQAPPRAVFRGLIVAAPGRTRLPPFNMRRAASGRGGVLASAMTRTHSPTHLHRRILSRSLRLAGGQRWPPPAPEEPLPPLLYAALLEEVEGRFRSAREIAKEVQRKHQDLKLQQQLLLTNLIGVAELRLGDVVSARRSLGVASSMAIAMGNVGRADDAYCDVGGVLNDLAVAKMLTGDLEDAHKDLNRAMFMGERAYRPDNDLLGAIQSNLGELACLRGQWDEAEAHHARAVHYADFIEHSARATAARTIAQVQRAASGAEGVAGAGGAGGCQVGATVEAEARPIEQLEPPRVPPGLLGVYTRNVVRRMNLGRVRARQGRDKEAVIHLHQALQDSRMLGRNSLQAHVVLYAQCLAAVADTHLSATLRTGSTTDVSHLRVSEEHEVTWHPQALLEKALSVMGAVLGHHHHETWACRGNLALLLPLDFGHTSLQELQRMVQDAAPAPETETLTTLAGAAGIKSTKATKADPQWTDEEVPVGVWGATLHVLSHNLSLLDQLQGPQSRDRSAHSLADMGHSPKRPGHKPKRPAGGGGEGGPRLLWPTQGVLGVGLRIPSSMRDQ